MAADDVALSAKPAAANLPEGPVERIESHLFWPHQYGGVMPTSLDQDTTPSLVVITNFLQSLYAPKQVSEVELYGTIGKEDYEGKNILGRFPKRHALNQRRRGGDWIVSVRFVLGLVLLIGLAHCAPL